MCPPKVQYFRNQQRNHGRSRWRWTPSSLPPAIPSELMPELVIHYLPPLAIVNFLTIRSGVTVPAFVSCSVFVNPPGALSVKSLIVRLMDGVEELIVTVLVTPLVMKI